MRLAIYRATFIAFCCAALVMTSCVDLTEVTKFAAQSSNAKSSLTALVADFKDTCERRNQFAPSDAAPQDCSKYPPLASGTLAAQDVLLKYMSALGTLSSDQKVTFDQDLKALPDKLKSSGLDEKQVTAATTLASKLADAALNGYRREKIAQLVGEENEDVHTLTSALSKIIGTDYKNLLSNESSSMDSFYKSALMKESSTQRLDAILVTNQWRSQQVELTKKLNAAEAYADIMKSIADGHQQLYDQRNNFAVKELAKTLGPDIEAIGNATQTVYTAFK
jgi:hypothetical protein